MVNNAIVKIWDQEAGALLLDENSGNISFEYFPEFEKRGYELSPIWLPFVKGKVYSYPELRDNETYHGLPGFIADMLPDQWGTALMERWLAENGRPSGSYNIIERLLYMGKRGMGALEFYPETRNDLSNSIEIKELSSLVRVAREIISSRNTVKIKFDDNSKSAIKAIISIGTSAGGSRAKAVVAYNKKTKEIRSGQVDAPEGFEHYLIKLDGVTNKILGDPQYFGCIEYSYYSIAKACGIDMTESFLLPDHKHRHFMTKRYDRTGNHKVHKVSLCGINNLDFNMPGAYSYEQLFEVMRMLRLPKSDAEQSYRRMVFNVIGRNQDDHTKNFDFLMDTDGIWKLSPAFDMTYSYKKQGRWTSRHQMTINGKDEDFTREDLLKIAKDINLKNGNEIINQIKEIFKHFEEYMHPDIPDKMVSEMKSNLLLSI